MSNIRTIALYISFLCLATAGQAQAQTLGTAGGQGQQKLSTYQLKLGGGAALLVLGTVHTHDPDDPQLAEMEQKFAAFNPNEVLIEGGKWPVAASKREAMSNYGELGLAHFLAKERALTAGDADPGFAAEMTHVSALHGAEETKLYYVLRMLPQFRREADSTPLEAKVARWLNYATFDEVPSLKGVMVSIPELDAATRKWFPAAGDWRDAKWESVYTDVHTPPLKGVAWTSIHFRDNYLTEQLVKGLRAGKRILAVVGLTHLDAQRAAVLPALLAK